MKLHKSEKTPFAEETRQAHVVISMFTRSQYKVKCALNSLTRLDCLSLGGRRLSILDTLSCFAKDILSHLTSC